MEEEDIIVPMVRNAKQQSIQNVIAQNTRSDTLSRLTASSWAAKQSSRNVNSNHQVELYENKPDRVHSLRESLKNYLLIKRNAYLNRPEKIPTEDDILKCGCVSSIGLTE